MRCSMFPDEAIRLVLRLEQSHEPIELRSISIASTHDRRHADAQALARNTNRVHPQCAELCTLEDLRNYQLHLVDRGTSAFTLNATITGLKFFFSVTLDRGAMMSKMQHVFVPRTLPVVLSREEAKRLIAASDNLKHQTTLSVAYGAGLRASEVSGLKVGDVDSQRVVLRIQQGKGGKDRGLNPIEPLSPRQLNRAVEDIRVIQVLLGHKKLETTALYTQVASETLRQVISPLEPRPA